MRSQENGGYFEEDFVRELFGRIENPVAKHEKIDLKDPGIQLDAAKMSVMRAWRLHDNLGGIVTVFTRITPDEGASAFREIAWTADLSEPEQAERIGKFYSDLVDMKKSQEFSTVVDYLDEFARNL